MSKRKVCRAVAAAMDAPRASTDIILVAEPLAHEHAAEPCERRETVGAGERPRLESPVRRMRARNLSNETAAISHARTFGDPLGNRDWDGAFSVGSCRYPEDGHRAPVLRALIFIGERFFRVRHFRHPRYLTI